MSMYGKPRLVIDCSDSPSMTKQSFAAEVDINKIIAGFEKTGMLNQLNTREPFYGDVSEIGTYQDAVNIVKEAEDLFMGMSATIRERFGNDPALMIRFLEDPKNLDEAVELGMAVRRVDAPPTKVEIVNQPESAVSEAKVVKSKKSSKEED